MNIALSAFLLLALIIPGFIFLNAYDRKENTAIERKPFDVSSAMAFFFSVLIHLVLIAVATWLGYTVNLELLIKLLTSSSLSTQEIATLAENAPLVTIYFLAAYSLPFGLGKLAQTAMFKMNPYKSSAFSFDTPWYYELKGKLSQTNNAQIIKLSCLQDLQDGSYLYYGFLEDFYLTRDGQLDRLVLSDVFRRRITSDQENIQQPPEERFYEVKGDRVVLKYEEIKNINIEYFYITNA